MSDEGSGYGLSHPESGEIIEAPQVDYLPAVGNYRPKIALIGAGGIAEYHLRAYRKLQLDVVAICDLDEQKATERAREFFPQATVSRDYRDILRDGRVEVVDVATHVDQRPDIIRDCLNNKRHVLSQKPFVVDLEEGQRLVDLADRHGCRLAVNQNGRFAPHFRYITQLIKRGDIGPVASTDFLASWDHTWTEGTAFEEIHHLLLFDFGIHWFDITNAFLGPKAIDTVYASTRRASYQSAKPPFLAHVVMDGQQCQARICFNALTVYGQEDRTVVVGQQATLRACGPSLNQQRVHIWNPQGHGDANLTGSWFGEGFEGTMAELVTSIEQDREPENNARDNLKSLQMCFAAMQSANTGRCVEVKKVSRMPGS